MLNQSLTGWMHRESADNVQFTFCITFESLCPCYRVNPLSYDVSHLLILLFAFREDSSFDWQQVTPEEALPMKINRAPRQPLPKVGFKF